MCAITSAMALCLHASCREKPGERNRAGEGALAAPTTDALWALAPPDLRSAVVIADGAVGRVRGALVTLEDLLGRSLATEELARELRATLTVGGISLLDAKPADIGVDLARGMASFTGGAGPVLVLPVVDAARLVAATGGESQGGVDRLGRELFCKMVSGRYVCASWAGQLDTLGRAAASPVAEWNAELRGDVEVFIARMPDEVDQLLRQAGLQAAHGIRIGARLERGGVTIRAHLRGKLDGPLEQARTPEPSRLLAGADRAPAGLFAVKGAGLWRAFGEHLVAELPAKILPGDVTLGQVAASIDGEIVGWAYPGPVERYTLLVGLTTEGPMRKLLAACDQLASVLGPTVKVAVKGERCAIAEDPAAADASPSDVVDAEMWVESGALRIEAKGSATAATAASPAPQAASRARQAAAPLPDFAREVADRPSLFATWGHGSFIGSIYAANLVELGEAAQGGDAMRLAVRWLYFVNELGVALRVEDDGVHAALRVRTLWANPDPLIAEMQDMIEQLVERKPEARARMAALAARFPDSPLAADVRAGSGGLTVQLLPFIAVGVMSMWAAERFATSDSSSPQGDRK